jgi:transglutaminase-like putative cysteine protease
MRFITFFIVCAALSINVFAQNEILDIAKYSALTLADSIKKDVDAVYRLDEGFVDITSPSKYSYKVHNIVTLLNDKASHHLNHVLHFDRFEKVYDVEIKVYNSMGLLVKKYGKKDFETSAYDDRISLYIEDKLLHLETPAPGYPCTIETSYELRTTSYIELPDWVIASPGEKVQASTFTVKVPAELDIHHSTVGIDIKPEVTTEGNFKIYKWTASNITGNRNEEDSYEKGTYAQRIQVSPQVFEYDGYKGEMKSWQAFGAWNYPLYEEKEPFNKAQAQEILDAVTACKNDKEKIKVLYNRLQKSMRYVSIQLGIGGFKPFAVQFVHDKKYGDCKALTNYMRYMLKTAGIKAYPALVNAGYNKPSANPDFPTDVFNHVILCVPLQKDTVWLECTSNNSECGVLGSFTENKNALLLTENGGVLIPTPKSDYNKNVLSTRTIININEDGGSKASTQIYCNGEFADMFHYIGQQEKDKQKEIFINYLKYRMPDEFTVEAKGDIAETNAFDVKLSYEQQYDFKAGGMFFYPQRIYNVCSETLSPATKRQNDYIFNFPYNKKDTTIYILPAGTTVSNLPVKKEISNNYLHYTNEFIKNDSANTITVIAELSVLNQKVPSAAYSEVSDFFNKIKENEKEKIVLKKG